MWMTVFQDHLCNDPTEGFFTAKPTHSRAVFTLWVYIPTHLPCPTLSVPTEPIPQGNCWKWHHKLFDTYMYAIAFKAAWRVMQTLEIWADTKSCQDISCLFKDCLVILVSIYCVSMLSLHIKSTDSMISDWPVFIFMSPVYHPLTTHYKVQWRLEWATVSSW